MKSKKNHRRGQTNRHGGGSMFMTPHSHLDHFHAHVHTHSSEKPAHALRTTHCLADLFKSQELCLSFPTSCSQKYLWASSVAFFFSPVCICIDCTYYSRASVESPEMESIACLISTYRWCKVILKSNHLKWVEFLVSCRFLPVPHLPFHVSVSPFPSSSPPPPLLLPPTSVLQLRLQQRRAREQLADQGIMPRE